MMRARGIAIALVLLPAIAAAQSVVQDANGRTAILLPLGGSLLSINTSTAAIEYSLVRLTSASPLFFGGAVSGRAVEGVAPLIGSGKTRAGAAFAAVFGIKSGGRLLAARYRRGFSGITLVDDAATPVPRAVERTVVDQEMGVAARLVLGSRAVLGVAGGSRQLHNYARLSKVQLRTTRTASDPATGAVVDLVTTVEGRTGAFAQEEVGFLDADLLVALPVSGLNARAYVRTLPGRDSGSRQRGAWGVDLAVHGRGGDLLADRKLALVFEVAEDVTGDPADDRLADRISVSLLADATRLLTALRGALGL